MPHDHCVVWQPSSLLLFGQHLRHTVRSLYQPSRQMFLSQ